MKKFLISALCLALGGGCVVDPGFTAMDNRVVRAKKVGDFLAAAEASHDRTKYYVSKAKSAGDPTTKSMMLSSALGSATETFKLYDQARIPMEGLQTAELMLGLYGDSLSASADKRAGPEERKKNMQFALRFADAVIVRYSNSGSDVVDRVVEGLLSQERNEYLYTSTSKLSIYADLISGARQANAERLYKMSRVSGDSIFYDSNLYLKGPDFFEAIGKKSIAQDIIRERALLADYKSNALKGWGLFSDECSTAGNCFAQGSLKEYKSFEYNYYALGYVGLIGASCNQSINAKIQKNFLLNQLLKAKQGERDSMAWGEIYEKHAKARSNDSVSSGDALAMYGSLQELFSSLDSQGARDAKKLFEFMMENSDKQLSEMFSDMSQDALQGGDVGKAALLKAASLFSVVESSNLTAKTSPEKLHSMSNESYALAVNYGNKAERYQAALSDMAKDFLGLDDQRCEKVIKE